MKTANAPTTALLTGRTCTIARSYADAIDHHHLYVMHTEDQGYVRREEPLGKVYDEVYDLFARLRVVAK